MSMTVALTAWKQQMFWKTQMQCVMMPFTMASGIHHRLPCRWCDGVANRHQLRVVPAIQTQHLQHHVEFQIKILDCYLYANSCDLRCTHTKQSAL